MPAGKLLQAVARGVINAWVRPSIQHGASARFGRFLTQPAITVASRGNQISPLGARNFSLIPTKSQISQLGVRNFSLTPKNNVPFYPDDGKFAEELTRRVQGEKAHDFVSKLAKSQAATKALEISAANWGARTLRTQERYVSKTYPTSSVNKQIKDRVEQLKMVSDEQRSLNRPVIPFNPKFNDPDFIWGPEQLKFRSEIWQENFANEYKYLHKYLEQSYDLPQGFVRDATVEYVAGRMSGLQWECEKLATDLLTKAAKQFRTRIATETEEEQLARAWRENPLEFPPHSNS